MRNGVRRAGATGPGCSARGELHDDLAWTYANPQHDAEPVRDSIAFFDERVDLDIDGAREERPRTQWSR